MASTFPTTLDVLSNPAGTDTMALHADQHANANDAIEAVQARLGVTGTAVAGTVEKRLVDVIATAAAALPSAGLDTALTAAQVVTYSTNVTGGSEISTPVSALKLPPGETDLTAGIGGGSSGLARPQIKVCMLGDSVGAAMGSLFSRLNKISGNRFFLIKNGSIPGTSSGGVLFGIETNIDPTADVVIVMAGSNDATTNIGVGAYYNNMKAIGQYVLDHNQQLIIMAPPPRDLAGTTVSKYMMKYPLASWLVAYDLNAIYCDPWRDFRSVSGEWNTLTTSNDNTHPALPETFYNAAQKLYDAINSAVVGQLPVIEPFSDDENAGYSSVANVGAALTLGNALLQDGTAGWRLVDPLTPTNTLANAAVALSTGSAAPFRGNELVIDFSAGTTANFAVSRRFLVSANTNRPAAGATVMCCAVVRATNMVNARVKVYSYAPNGGWADKAITATVRYDFEREFFTTGMFLAGSASAQEYSIVVEVTRIDTGLPATGSVGISNADMYNLSKLRTSQFGV